ncbi:MAG TPA: HAD family phosphatase [Candidatus Gallacutalibacter stercoravium]|nr:HAD family phosphatase [Candidatus Gallacutalibacter stercoravium]
MVPYQLLALDLDGTLTNSQKQITPRTQQALCAAQQAGVRLALVSGRPACGIWPLARALDLPRFDGYILAMNGCQIIRCADEAVLFEQCLPDDYRKELCGLAREYQIDCIVYSKTGILTENSQSPYIQLDAKINGIPIHEVPCLVEAVDFPLDKLLLIGEPPVMEELLPKIRQRYPFFEVFRSEPYFLEIVPRGVDKAASLQRLMKICNLAENGFMACGDGYNDLSMLRAAALGVAMANAQPVVQEAADWVAPSNDEDGVAVAVERFLLHDTQQG